MLDWPEPVQFILVKTVLAEQEGGENFQLTNGDIIALRLRPPDWTT